MKVKNSENDKSVDIKIPKPECKIILRMIRAVKWKNRIRFKPSQNGISFPFPIYIPPKTQQTCSDNAAGR
jgi:hypothetical protein